MRCLKNNLFLPAALIISCCSLDGSIENKIAEDADWNSRFIISCAMPRQDSIQWMDNDRRFVRFTLNDKDKGECSTDKIARHRAPYWERAELKQNSILSEGSVYTVDATMRFVEGFAGERETFMQIHAYNAECKQAYPPLMLKFDNSLAQPAVLTLHVLQSFGHHIRYQSDITIDQILGDWIDLSLKIDTSDKKTVSLYFNGNALFTEVPYWVEPCGKMYLKIGAYRPGSTSGNNRSVVDFDSINIEKN